MVPLKAFLAVFFMGTVLLGCSTLTPQESLRGACYAGYSSRNPWRMPCIETTEFCPAFFPGQALEEMNTTQCIEHCNRVWDENYMRYNLRGCGDTFFIARSKCRNYCKVKDRQKKQEE